MYIGNVMLLILNLPLVGVFVNFLRIPYRTLYPIILLFCLLGVYAVNSSALDVWIMAIMGLLGYGLRKLGFESAPIILGLVLGPLVEMSLRQSLVMSGGNYLIFVQHPIAAALLCMAAALLAMALVPLALRGLNWRARLGVEGHEG